jgi:hypothetical protein
VVADLPPDHRLFRDELFVPFVAAVTRWSRSWPWPLPRC